MQGVNPNSRDQTGKTPLSAAAEKGEGETVRVLLSWPGVDPEVRDMDGRTPLSLAAGAGRADVVQQLLAAEDVAPNSRDHSGRTPLSWAVDGEVSSQRNKTIQRLLQTSSVDPNAKDNEGRTPMDRALDIERGDEIVDMLLSRSDTKPVLERRSGQAPGWVPRRSDGSPLAALQSATAGTIDPTAEDENKGVSDVEKAECSTASGPIDATPFQPGIPHAGSQPLVWLGYGTEMEMELSHELTRSVRITLHAQPLGGHHTATAGDDTSLCSRCEMVDWDDVFACAPKLTGRCVISDLGTVDETWERRPCAICRLIGSIWPRLPPTTGLNSAASERNSQLYAFSSTDVWLCQGSLAWHYEFRTAWIDTVFLAVIADNDRRSRKGRGEFEYAEADITLADWLRDSLLSSGFVPRLGSNCSHGTRSLDIRKAPRDGINYSMVRGWLDFCEASHSHWCGPKTTEPVPHLRLIECATRRVVTPGSAVPFAALSYVWGISPASSDPRNHDTLGDGEVEPVVEDAILVTMSLGYAYLWIDRYCITTGNEAIREQQLRDMGLVYGNAALTIVAAAGGDATFGLPGVRPRQAKTAQFTEKPKGHLLVSIPPDPATALKSSVWATRGWTYQEGLLSRRWLIFTEHEISFECGRSLFREAVGLPRRIHDMSFSYANRLQPESWSFSARAANSNTLSLLSDYTRRRLTYESDILNAMLGIFRTLGGNEIHHLCGVPMLPVRNVGSRELGTAAAEGLANGLLWNLSTPGHRRPGFPSWSWTGWSGVVSLSGFGGIGTSFSPGFEVEMAVLFVERQLEIPFSEYEQMTSTEKLTTFRQHHVLQLSAETLVVELREDVGGGWRAYACIGDEFLDGDFSPTRYHLSGEDRGNFARRLREESWLCLVLGQTISNATWVMVVIEYVHSTKSWERVGLLAVDNVQLRKDVLERRTIRLG